MEEVNRFSSKEYTQMTKESFLNTLFEDCEPGDKEILSELVLRYLDQIPNVASLAPEVVIPG